MRRRTPTELALARFRNEGAFHSLPLRDIVDLLHNRPRAVTHEGRQESYRRAREAQLRIVLHQNTPRNIRRVWPYASGDKRRGGVR